MKIIKIISIFILILMLTNSLTVITFARGQEEKNYRQEIELLYQLGVIHDDEMADVDELAKVTRAQFVTMVIRVFKYDNISLDSDECFTDVTTDNTAYSAINAAVAMGIVEKASSGKFEPDSVITKPQAAKIVLSALGYKKYAEQIGGFPAGYMTLARSTKLFKDISVEKVAEISYGEAVQLLYNALDAKYMEAKLVNNSIQYSNDRSDTPLSRIYKLSKNKGLVTGNTFTSIDCTSTTSDSSIAINHVIYNTDSNIYNNFLGKNVIFLTKTDSPDIITNMVIDTANDHETYVTAPMISSINNNEIIYFTNFDKTATKKETLDANAKIIKNGVFAGTLNNFAEGIGIPDSGNFNLIDSDDNGSVDIVIINEYTTFVVDSINASKQLIYDKYGNGSIDCSNDDNNLTLKIVKDGNEIPFSDIKPLNVLSVYKTFFGDNKRYINIVVSTKTVSGAVSEMTSSDNSKIKAVINEKEYTVSDNYHSNGAYTKGAIEIKLGISVTAYLSYEGQIAGIELKKQIERYGYLIKFAAKNNNFLDTYEFKIFTQDNKIQVLQSVKDIYVNGICKPNLYTALIAKGADGSILKDANGNSYYHQLIKFRLDDDGNIAEIFTAEPKSPDDNSKKFSINYMKNNVMYFYENPNIDYFYKITDQTKAFVIPYDLTNDEGYYILNTQDASDINRLEDIKSDVGLYDCDTAYSIGAMVINEANLYRPADGIMKTIEERLLYQSSLEYPCILVKNISYSVDAKGNNTYKLTGIYKSKLTTFTVDEKVLKYSLGSNIILPGISSGDIIRCQLSKTKIRNVYLAYRNSDRVLNPPQPANTIQTSYSSATNKGNGVSGYSERYWFDNNPYDLLSCYGKITKLVNGKLMFVNISPTETKTRMFNFVKYTFVYIYNKSTGNVRVGTLDDLYEGAEIYADSQKMRTLGIVIYEK